MTAMRRVPATEFKAKCLSLLDRVGPEGFLITRHGRPVARLTPVAAGSGSLIGRLRGKIKIKGDIYSTGLAWNAQSRHARPSVRPRR
jgi:prevent-host-death family protein